jgi:hypothetical protein
MACSTPSRIPTARLGYTPQRQKVKCPTEVCYLYAMLPPRPPLGPVAKKAANPCELKFSVQSVREDSNLPPFDPQTACPTPRVRFSIPQRDQKIAVRGPTSVICHISSLISTGLPFHGRDLTSFAIGPDVATEQTRLFMTGIEALRTRILRPIPAMDRITSPEIHVFVRRYAFACRSGLPGRDSRDARSRKSICVGERDAMSNPSPRVSFDCNLEGFTDRATKLQMRDNGGSRACLGNHWFGCPFLGRCGARSVDSSPSGFAVRRTHCSPP